MIPQRIWRSLKYALHKCADELFIITKASQLIRGDLQTVWIFDWSYLILFVWSIFTYFKLLQIYEKVPPISISLIPKNPIYFLSLFIKNHTHLSHSRKLVLIFNQIFGNQKNKKLKISLLIIFNTSRFEGFFYFVNK